MEIGKKFKRCFCTILQGHLKWESMQLQNGLTADLLIGVTCLRQFWMPAARLCFLSGLESVIRRKKCCMLVHLVLQVESWAITDWFWKKRTGWERIWIWANSFSSVFRLSSTESPFLLRVPFLRSPFPSSLLPSAPPPHPPSRTSSESVLRTPEKAAMNSEMERNKHRSTTVLATSCVVDGF